MLDGKWTSGCRPGQSSEGPLQLPQGVSGRLEVARLLKLGSGLGASWQELWDFGAGLVVGVFDTYPPKSA